MVKAAAMQASASEKKHDNAPVRWSAVIPFYNEEAYLRRTLDCLAAQTLTPDEIILVDNASTDGSAAVAQGFAADHPGLNVRLIEETEPGKISALKAGGAVAKGRFLAMCDADTIYPPDYLEKAQRLFDRSEDIVAALAFGVYEDWPEGKRRTFRRRRALAAKLMPRQCHTGGYGQCFRRSAYEAAGGYSKDIWKYMVADHEIMHRMAKLGRLAYDVDHWCVTSARRDDRARVDWGLREQLMYHLTPFARKDWFFYRFLQRRFAARGFENTNLRARSWEAPE